MHNIADEHPDILEKLKGLWYYYAGVYHGLPLDDRSALEIVTTPRPQPSKPRNRYIYYPDSADVPEMVAVNIRRRSYTIAAGAVIDSPDAEGVLFAQGGVTGGHSLYIKDRKLHYLYNWLGEKFQKVTSEIEISTGKHAFTAEFVKTGDDQETMSAVGTLTLYIDTKPVGQATIMTQPGLLLSGRRRPLRRKGQRIPGLARLCCTLPLHGRNNREGDRGRERGDLRGPRERGRGLADEGLTDRQNLILFVPQTDYRYSLHACL